MLFSSLNIMLYRWASVHREKRDCMLGFDAPFDPLRVKDAPGRDKKERKADSEDNSDGSGSDEVNSSRPTRPFQWMEANLAAMRELLGGLPRLSKGGASSNTVVVDPKAHVELREVLKKEKKKTISRLAFCSHVEGVKKIYRTLLLGCRVPPFSSRNVLEYSFSSGEDEETSGPGDDSNEASS
ncbi:hypothetical protein HAX54_040274 [Datura stramonium]|uniref:Uncharacterized protein n=1 Tax=Datura stramonium TaxID=4076 RepID=A0ABS8SKC4_DATST|nr:hypothetical protein [Datura stramonium]